MTTGWTFFFYFSFGSEGSGCCLLLRSFFLSENDFFFLQINRSGQEQEDLICQLQSLAEQTPWLARLPRISRFPCSFEMLCSKARSDTRSRGSCDLLRDHALWTHCSSQLDIQRVGFIIFFHPFHTNPSEGLRESLSFMMKPDYLILEGSGGLQNVFVIWDICCCSCLVIYSVLFH